MSGGSRRVFAACSAIVNNRTVQFVFSYEFSFFGFWLYACIEGEDNLAAH